jgi:hypothetical protein
MRLVHIFQFAGIWILTFLITFIFIIPETDPYQTALERYDQLVTEQRIDQPDFETPFKLGFTFAYAITNNPLFFLMILLAQTAFSLGIILLLHFRRKSKPDRKLLPDPLDSLKNVLSNVVLFTMGVFNRRASEPLRYYFDLPAKSRLIALVAYALIFFSISTSYDYPLFHFANGLWD